MIGRQMRRYVYRMTYKLTWKESKILHLLITSKIDHTKWCDLF